MCPVMTNHLSWNDTVLFPSTGYVKTLLEFLIQHNNSTKSNKKVEHPCWSAISIKFGSSAWVFSFKFAAYCQNTFSKNTWRAASVSRKINFEKWEQIRLDYDENITITYFFAVEQVIIIKIWILRSQRQLDKK